MQDLRELKRKIQSETSQAYWRYVESVITPLEGDDEFTGMKRFWTFIKQMKTDNIGVAPLKEKDVTATSAKGKADILNRQFESVFSQNTDQDTREKDRENIYPNMEDINITQEGVKSLLQKLNPHKAAGPDQLAPRVLKELA